MGDWPQQNEDYGIANEVISISHPWALGTAWRLYGTGAVASGAWPATDRVLLWPFRLPRQMTCYQIGVGGGATASGNYDAGIYDWFGNRLVNTGSVAKGNSAETFTNTTDLVLGPGRYWAALQASTTANYMIVSAAQAGLVKAMGVRQASPGSFGLPSTVTFQTAAGVQIPVCLGLWMRSTA